MATHFRSLGKPKRLAHPYKRSSAFRTRHALQDISGQIELQDRHERLERLRNRRKAGKFIDQSRLIGLSPTERDYVFGRTQVNPVDIHKTHKQEEGDE